MYANLYIETIDPDQQARLLALAEAEDARRSGFTAVERAISEVAASGRAHAERMNGDRAEDVRLFQRTSGRPLPTVRGFTSPHRPALREPTRTWG
jgi:hypothetical protein